MSLKSNFFVSLELDQNQTKYNSPFTINNYTYVSEGIIDLYGPKYAYLIVDDYNNNVNNSFYSAFNSSLNWITSFFILANLCIGVSNAASLDL